MKKKINFVSLFLLFPISIFSQNFNFPNLNDKPNGLVRISDRLPDDKTELSGLLAQAKSESNKINVRIESLKELLKQTIEFQNAAKANNENSRKQTLKKIQDLFRCDATNCDFQDYNKYFFNDLIREIMNFSYFNYSYSNSDEILMRYYGKLSSIQYTMQWKISSDIYRKLSMGIIQGQENTKTVSKFPKKEVDTLMEELKIIKLDIEEIEGFQKSIDGEIENQDKRLKEIDKYIENLEKKLKDQSIDITRLAVIVGLPAFCITIVILFLGPYIILTINKGSNIESISTGLVLELITVLLLTMSILILGLANKLPGEVLGTLIGGISGYVLNRFSSELKEKKRNNL